ncbi:MAG: hypothetical protein ACLTCB_02005 [Merdibacter sp.]
MRTGARPAPHHRHHRQESGRPCPSSPASTDAGLSSVLQTMFTPLSAFAFLCFTVLFMPCVAAFAATKRELGTLKEALFAVLFQTGVAYIVALIIYQAGSVFL